MEAPEEAKEVTLRCVSDYSNRKTRYQVGTEFTVDERRAQHLLADSPGSFAVVEPEAEAEADGDQTPPDTGGQAQGEPGQKAPAKPPRNKMLNPDDNEVK